MKVPHVHGPGDLRLDDVSTPSAGPRDVVIRTAVVGVCGSDIGYLAAGGVAGPGRPMPLGHELCGTVVEAGAQVESVSPGDRVILNPMHNFVGNGGPEGGFAERLLVRDVAGQPDSLIPMPSSMPFEAGALAEPLSVALHTLNGSKAKPGDKVAIYGAGPIGLALLALMRKRGVDGVVVFDPSPLRRERASALGAHAALDPREQPPATALAALHGAASLYGGQVVATNVFIDAAGAPGIVEEVVAMAPFGASLTVVAVQKKPVSLDFQKLLGKEMTLRASLAYPSEFPEAIALLAEGLDLGPLITHRFRGEEVMEAFDVAGRTHEAVKVLVDYG